jgi:hypothetical protein
VAKAFKGFRFEPALYGQFQKLAASGGYTATGAFEQFMRNCLEVGALIFPDKASVTKNSEAEARILVDWLAKGRHFYRTADNQELNVAGRLLELLPKVHEAALRLRVEEVLKQSVVHPSTTS